MSGATLPGTAITGTTMPSSAISNTAMPGTTMKGGPQLSSMSATTRKVLPQSTTPFKKPEHPPPTPFKITPSTKLEDWKKWQITFRYYAHAINLEQKSHDVQLSTFKSVVGPDALEIYNTFSILDITDVESVMRKFDDHFKPKVNVTLERYKLYKLYQKSGQKFDDFLSDVTNLVDKCEFNSMRDDIILYKIVGGIDNEEIRNALLADADLKYEKAIQICRASSTMHFMSDKENVRKGKENAKKSIELETALEVVLTEGTKKNRKVVHAKQINEKLRSVNKMPKNSKTTPTIIHPIHLSHSDEPNQVINDSQDKSVDELLKEDVAREEIIEAVNHVETAGPSKEEFLKEYVQLKPSRPTQAAIYRYDPVDATLKTDDSSDGGDGDGGDSDWRGDDEDYSNNSDNDGLETSVKRENEQKDGRKKSQKKKRKLRRRKSTTGTTTIKLSCDMCDRTFLAEIALEKHRNSHISVRDKTAVCYYCGKQYKKEFLRKHMVQRHYDILGIPGPKMFACDACHFMTRFPENLQRHKFQHTGEKPLACDRCDYKCITQRLMKAHVAKVHTGERPFSCSVCKRGFLHSDALKRHMITHGPPEERRKFQDRVRSTCEICGKVFSSRTALQTHAMRHSGDKPYACHFCDFRTVTNGALNSHILSKHSDEKPFVCTACGYSCKQKTVLKQHMMTHTAEKPHACEICGRKFSQISHVKRHKMTHTGEKPHVCEICGHRWTTKENLKAHMKVHQKQTGDLTQYTPPRKRQKKVVTIIAAPQQQSEESAHSGHSVHSEPAAADAIIQWSEQVSAINSIDYTPSLETPPPFHPTYPVHQGNPRPPDCRYYQQRQWQNQGYR